MPFTARITPARSTRPAFRIFDQYRNLLPLHEAFPRRYPHLLESVVQGPEHARFDILFAFPGETLELTHDFRLGGRDAGGEPDFLNAFDLWWRSEADVPPPETTLPFHGGWFIYLGYELGTRIEPSVPLAPVAGRLPHAFAMRVPAAIIRDHVQRRTVIVTEPGKTHLLDRITEDLTRIEHDALDRHCPQPALNLREDDPTAFLAGVRRIKDYIRDGDVFQVNLSRAWTGIVDSTATPGALYRRLRDHNPGPFAGLAGYGNLRVLSSSPERLVHTTADGVIETRPIAGTRPRGEDTVTDRRFSETLLAHPKERAEHVMLIDLERNDLGRLCRHGSVVVNELMVLESYRHVHHIVSNVRGLLRAGVTPGQVIRAVFPGGTITGCPKVRCMQIIAELEGAARGPYTGAMGYINRDGSMDLNILIRTLSLNGHRLTLRTGAGIVADSDPDMELEETRAKAKGLLMALSAP